MINRLFTTIFRVFVATALFYCAMPANAQQMPQDNWRDDGLQFSSPTNNGLHSIGIGTGGVYVGEVNGGNPTKLIQFSEGGVFIRRFSADFGYILGIACDPAGNVYVLDRDDSKVKVFDSSGNFLREWGGAGGADGQFSFGGVTYVAMITVDKSNRVYVCDPGNLRVQVFDSNGSFLRKWGNQGDLPDQFSGVNPASITWSPKGELYVGCASGPSLRIFSEDGHYLRSNAAIFSPGFPGLNAITPDGLLIAQSWYSFYANVFDSGFNYIVGLGLDYNGSGFAVSKRGDLFTIGGDGVRIHVYEREYSSVRNSLLPPAIPLPLVLSAAQRAGTSWMDIDYQVTDVDSPTVTTGALAFRDGGNTLNEAVLMSTFMEGTGANLGSNQPANVSRHLTWNMAADWSVDFAQVQVEAMAKDSRNLLGVHWITIPASGSNPSVQISSAPIRDEQLLDLWYWFLGTHYSGVGFANGIVRGTTGIYSGQVLASSTSTTGIGRLFAYEQIGVRPIAPSEVARALAGNYGFSSVDGNSIVKVAAATTSYLKAWGYNGNGEGNTTISSAGAVKATAGYNNNLFIKADGSLWAFGYNGYGQLGDGTTVSRIGPVQVSTDVVQAAAGANHSLFVKTDGTLWAMGNNDNGQLGDGSTTRRSNPVQVATNVVQAAAGGAHSLFLKIDGTLWAMGYNGYGQLGDGTNSDRATPVQIATGVSRLATGSTSYHSFFITTDGSLWGMGNNDNGQLGDGSTTRWNTPVQIATGVTQVAVGGNHTLFVKTDGTMWAMGINGNGQLGDGTTIQRYTPVQVATGVAQVAAGANHSLFLKGDGTLWAMGYNGYGQLGDGTTNDQSTPFQVEQNVTAMAAGAYHSIAVITAP